MEYASLLDESRSFNQLLFLSVISSLQSYIHTYVIDHYNSSVRITAWLFTPLMLCTLILYISRTYSLTSTPNDRFLKNFFMACWLINSQSFYQKSTERKSNTLPFRLRRLQFSKHRNSPLYPTQQQKTPTKFYSLSLLSKAVNPTFVGKLEKH